MTRTVTALYETKAQAERVRDTLVAAHLGDHVQIRDEAEGAKPGGPDVAQWLSGVFGGHKDRHVYGEGLRRGHILLAATVDDLNEIRAAELLDADAPVDLKQAEETWRADGWAPTGEAVAPADGAAPDASPVGVRVRVYSAFA